ncbi:mechanosensitive ion channel domain-containing protein [Flavobacterium hydatis]|jgi:small-conductance mechanosensitive channel|uniref:Mechanosensitive ion channel protein MscS n=1 Tax=Flavobacterium hydatis TaxID=991 RepID=A0A086AAC7_FLAHY|nr:mechanosensitive ion channel domain-containing protein [Flavobacterium hydatis]KFF13641.1 mechanosensitive ion channel protein MscS [Flavobacterium hydatis]OXA90290.1 mechanosensitive ion channel protein MscS [Flavobacterium hydatis]
MTAFFTDYAKEILATGILIVITAAVRITITQLVRRYAKKEHFLEHRTNLIIKYIHLLTNILFIIGLFVVWGVKTEDIFLTVSSIATVIGVAMFAQWSILSNITSGIILFFSFPFKIGDSIKIHDKDFPIEAEIEDINAFHVSLKTKEGEKIIYPNNLLLQKGISIIPAQFEDKEFFD